LKAERAGLVSIVIVNWNTRNLLLRCIGSILDGGCSVPCEIIVVDNASADGSVDAVRSAYPNVTVIANDRNLGFASANNVGFARASGESILLLNPDTIVSEKAADKLVAFLEAHSDVGIVGPLIVGQDGCPQISSFGIAPSLREAFLHAIRIWRIAPKSRLARQFLMIPREPEDWIYTRHLLGACMLVRRRVIDQTNGFDERFFLFLEETDLCYRTQQMGWRIAYYVGARITHLGEQSMLHILDRSGGYYIRSYNYFCRKHGMGRSSVPATNLCLIMGLINEAAIALAKHRSITRAANSLRAIWYGYVAKP